MMIVLITIIKFAHKWFF